MKQITCFALYSLLISIFGFHSCRNNTSVDTTKGTEDSIGLQQESTNVVTEKILVERIDTLSMIILYPAFNHIDFVCKDMPSQQDKSVLLCAAGSYTGQCLNTFRHDNIAGDHVSKGIRFDGYSCQANTGAFVYFNGQWKFLYENYSNYLDSAAINSGCGFAQEMLIHKGEKRRNINHNTGVNIFRALCEREGKLCVIESSSAISMEEFKSRLIELNVCEALYMDMGRGWNHAWYRVSKDSVKVLHPKSHNYCTNWITFYK